MDQQGNDYADHLARRIMAQVGSVQLVCAECLVRRFVEEEQDIACAAAITVLEGYALCSKHLAQAFQLKRISDAVEDALGDPGEGNR